MDIDLSLDYVTTLLAALLIGTGFVLQQHAAEVEPDSRFLSPRLIADLFRKPRWLAGIVCMVGGQVLAAWSIGHLELSLVEPLLTTNLIFALLLAVPLSGQSFRPREVAGAVILCTGVALMSASRSAKPIGLSFGSFSHWPAAAVIAAIAFILVHAGRRRSGRMRAALTGTAAGLVFGIQDALTRQTLEALQGSSWTVLFSTWSAYALLATGAVGIWLMQNAFSAGPLQASLPAISAGEPLVGILLGVIIFGDRVEVSPGWLAMQAGGIAALVVGVVTVASAPALAQLRERASKLRSAVGPLAGKPQGDVPAEAAEGPAAHREAAQDKGAPPDAVQADATRTDAAPSEPEPLRTAAAGPAPNGAAGTPAPRPAGTPAPRPAGTPAPRPAGTPAPRPAGTPAPNGAAESLRAPPAPPAPVAQRPGPGARGA